MNGQRQATARIDADCRLLVSLLEVETHNYKRLLRLAWRQNSYMKRQDVDRLEVNGREWARYLPVANESRLAREEYVQRMARERGMSIPPGSMTELLELVACDTKAEIQDAVNDLKATAVRLARQNELNKDLASFCLDLAHEEAKIFKQSVLKDPAGCYSGEAQNIQSGPGGVLVRQA
jgi:hypothetical protein